MTDGELEPRTDVKVHDVEAAEKRYDEASPENSEAAWFDLWHARDFTWQGRSEKAMLQTEMVEVPASFPNGREAEGEFKTVSLKDYWRWSIGLAGQERLLTDEEMREAGLLVEVEGETYHLIHAPDVGLKVDEHGTPLKVLRDAIAARAGRVPDDIGTDAEGRPNFARALQLPGVWLPGALLLHVNTGTAVKVSEASIFELNLGGRTVGHLICERSLFRCRPTPKSYNGDSGEFFYKVTFAGKANFRGAIFNCRADFGQATFRDTAVFVGALFRSMTNFERSTFGSAAGFESTSFGHPWTFKNGTFNGVANFTHANWPKENSPNSFKGARFKDRVFFESATEICISAFNEARFEITPSFTDLTQRQLDEVFGNSISQTKEPIKQAKKGKAEAKRKKEQYEGLTPDQLLAAQEGGFRTLKKVAEEKGNFLLSQAYYRFEIRTRVKRSEIAFWEKVSASLYGLSSDYGNSIARPFVSLTFILAGFAAIFLALAIQVGLVDWQDREAVQSGVLQSLDFSLNNVFRPLSALSTEAPREGETIRLAGKLLNNYGDAFGLIVTAISIVQSLTGIVLAFLFGLAVRRRFQIS